MIIHVILKFLEDHDKKNEKKYSNLKRDYVISVKTGN